MVGQPKHLSELNKIEADVRITCRRCGFEDDWTVADLTRHLHEIGGSTVWSEVTRYLACRKFGCGSNELRALPMPCARRQANLPQRIGKLDAHLLSTAFTVLEEAVARAPGRSVATLEVRLALLVLHRYARDREAARRFWEMAADKDRSVSEGLAEPYKLLRHRLERRGWIAPQVLPERTRNWPWKSPAPPGWKGKR